MRIAIATCKNIPEPDPDETLLLDALARAGADARLLAWDDPAAPFADHDLVVLRSTWNYFRDIEGFMAWAERTAKSTRFLNPVSVVRAHVVKTYLADLARRGIDIVPTEMIAHGETADFAKILAKHGWSEVVVKPLASAASYRTERFTAAEADRGQAFLEALVRDRAAMVQKWMPAVNDHGERSLVWIDGAITHAIRKTPRFAGGVEQVSGEVPIAPEERAFAERAIAAAQSWCGPGEELAYGRVDMIRDEGVLRVMELELVEPSLYFLQCPRALERFVLRLVR
jgi:glutathione synthase/RimK-type ligase-like ATP-grasp enzyme